MSNKTVMLIDIVRMLLAIGLIIAVLSGVSSWVTFPFVIVVLAGLVWSLLRPQGVFNNRETDW